MEFLREFRVKIYKDTNKETQEKTFDLEDYESLNELLKDLNRFLRLLKEEGILEAF